MTVPQLDLEGARQAQRVLLDHIAGLTDREARRPSGLTGWTVGHVLTHLARNADGHRAMFEAAARGQVGHQYPGGAAQRSADIEAGAGRPAADLVADVRDTARALDAAWAGAGDRAWAVAEGRLGTGAVVPLADLVFRRWREVEVHHADLGLGFGWSQWSDPYVDRELDRVAATLAPRLPAGTALRLDPTDVVGAWIVETEPAARTVVQASRHELLAWLIGRHARPDWPELAPW